MSCNKGGIFGGGIDWIWIIIAVIVVLCLCNDDGIFGRGCHEHECC